MLERWRKEANAQIVSDPNEFPDSNWRALGYAVTFFALAEVVVLTQSWLKFVQGIPTAVLYMCLLAICGGAGLVQAFHFMDIFNPQFWRATRSLFKKTDNYPFTPYFAPWSETLLRVSNSLTFRML